MELLIIQHYKFHPGLYRIVLVSIFIFLTGVLSINLKGQTWANKNIDDYWSSGRSGHSLAYLTNNRVLLFGGYNGEGELDDTYVYDLSSNSWQQLSPITKPSNRSYHAMANIGNNKVLLFGGSNNHNPFGDTWLFDGSINAWTLLNPVLSPSARYRHAMAYLGDDKVMLFGGHTDYGWIMSRATWIFDLSDNTWIEMGTSSYPQARAGHSIARIDEGKTILFGGYYGRDSPLCLSDTWIYDLATNKWTLATDETVPGPTERFGHSMSYLGEGEVILYGGYEVYNLSAPFGDTWIYDLHNNSWSEIISTSEPPALYYHALSETNINGGNVILFGGSPLSRETWFFKNLNEELTLLSPNGGENWQIETSHNITWTSPGNNENVQIEYSINNGSSWTNITNVAPDVGSFLWTIPNSPSTSCLVRVTGAYKDQSDLSDSVFTILPIQPFLKVSPESILLDYGSGSTGSFNISSNTSWYITEDASWLDVSPVSGSNNEIINVTAISANTGTSQRSTIVTIAGTGVADNTVMIKQSPYISNFIIFNPDLTYGTISDIDGNTYKTIQIGHQTWMAENLKTTKYSDGTSIRLISQDRPTLESPAYCWFNDDPNTYKPIYGALYNWFTVNTGKLCPEGWHVPNREEWTTLEGWLLEGGGVGGKMKESGTIHWASPNVGATNESGFTALPSGRDSYAIWWHSDGLLDLRFNEVPASSVYNSSDEFFREGPRDPFNLLSVRCIKDVATLNVSPTSIYLNNSSGSTGSFNISSNTSWNITDDIEWLSISPVSGSNNGAITVTTTSENTDTSPRTATVTISGTGFSNKTVQVIQQGYLTGINRIYNNNINLYPNPTNGLIKIESENIFPTGSRLEIYNCLGRIVLGKRLDEVRMHEINLSFLPEGMYFIKINYGEGFYLKKIVVKY